MFTNVVSSIALCRTTPAPLPFRRRQAELVPSLRAYEALRTRLQARLGLRGMRPQQIRYRRGHVSVQQRQDALQERNRHLQGAHRPLKARPCRAGVARTRSIQERASQWKPGVRARLI